ncbi:response regulator transcription factor [Neotamlana laminarinivorans]|uniref:Response regulator transcription factor n=1 Tax=Neotamlana laminarinivorans TaxID=2883124 RepID=A0A9X1HZC8_9FLAO|nr:response regulator transcription factor [Tamlana laminarinivorans]MCB4798381.1 response regulator transcription factor [Tamlana laminarinivorans]
MDFLIVDSYWPSRKGLITLVKSNFYSARILEFELLEELLLFNDLEKSSNNILLLDANMACDSFFENVEKLKDKFPEIKIILIASKINYFQFFKLKDHIHATLSKHQIEKKIFGAIEFVSKGYRDYFSSVNQTNSVIDIKKLTPRELEVAILLSKGFGNKEIVWKLNLKKETISTYRKRVFVKLNINNNIELANYFTKSIL